MFGTMIECGMSMIVANLPTLSAPLRSLYSKISSSSVVSNMKKALRLQTLQGNTDSNVHYLKSEDKTELPSLSQSNLQSQNDITNGDGVLDLEGQGLAG